MEGEERPPVGAPMRVQVLDTSYADAPAVVVTERDATVENRFGSLLSTVELDVRLPSDRPRHYTVRVHVDLDGNGPVSRGDFVTTVSYPLPEGGRVRAVVRKV